MSAALVHSTCADNCFALDAAFVRSTCFQCRAGFVYRASQDRLIVRLTHLHVHIATYEQFMPTPLNMLDCLLKYIECSKVLVAAFDARKHAKCALCVFHDNMRKKAGSSCSRMSAALVHSTCADNCFALDAAFVRSTCFQCKAGFIYRASQDRLIVR